VTRHRPERIGDLVRHVLARLLREELRDPRVGFVTVTEVTMSPDLRHARVWVSILGSDPADALTALGRALPFLRRALAREARLRFTPELHFALDESIAGGDRVERILQGLSDDDAPPASDPPSERNPR